MVNAEGIVNKIKGTQSQAENIVHKINGNGTEGMNKAERMVNKIKG